jgi:hypothetical protein
VVSTLDVYAIPSDTSRVSAKLSTEPVTQFVHTTTLAPVTSTTSMARGKPEGVGWIEGKPIVNSSSSRGRSVIGLRWWVVFWALFWGSVTRGELFFRW